MALFFANDRNELMPIAIQLFQKPSDENPVSHYYLLTSGPTEVQIKVMYAAEITKNIVATFDNSIITRLS